MQSRIFTVGPTQLHPQYLNFHKDAMNMNLGSIYHRSKEFHKLYQYADEQLKLLLGLNDEHSIYFTSGGTEIWEKSILNLTHEHTYHLINGEFGRKYFEYAQKLGKKSIAHEVTRATPFHLSSINIPEETEMVCLTINETASGFCLTQNECITLKEKASHTIISADAVSIAPLFASSYRIFDSFFFSVQKAFGMPPGLGVWIVNEKCKNKAAQLEADNKIRSAYHTLPDLELNYKKWETPSTPNTVAIYVLARIAEWMNRKGIENLESEIQQKANMIYDFFGQSRLFKTAVESKQHLSSTSLVAKCLQNPAQIIQHLHSNGITISKGYGSKQASEIRIGNFPQISIEDVSELIRILKYEDEKF